MSSLGIPSNLQAACGEAGIINLSWGDTAPTCDPYFSTPSGAIDEILKSSSKTWVLNNSLGTVLWEVSGTGASITQGGGVTTTGAACGTLTITATDSCCGVFTQQVRVTDSGIWTLISDEDVDTCSVGAPAGSCTYISGSQRIIYDWYVYHGNSGPQTQCSQYTGWFKCAIDNSMTINPCTGMPFVPAPGCISYGGDIDLYYLTRIRTYTWSCP